ncbi:MAG TPA: hypothetical protein VG053_07565 [Solirubrobacteraceae bacterium]|nr:hypothetical protein [Solirubrobacteraceae bacterium]
MTGSFICGCILFPLVLLGLSIGGGLLVRRLGGEWLPAGLIAPVGFALLVAWCSFASYIHWLAPVADYIALALALLGFALQWRARAPRAPRLDGVPWGALSGLAAFAAVGAPVLLTGTPTWTGYTRIVDIGLQMDFAHYMAHAGRAAVGLDSSYHVDVQKLVDIGYPGGAQATLGMVAKLIHTNVAWCYQMFHAFAAGMGALAIYSLLGRVTASRPLRALGAFVAIQPNVLYAYALAGGIKELTTAGLLMIVVAVLAERLPGEDGPHLSVLPAAVAISGAFAVFSDGIGPWLGLLLVGLFVVTLVRPNRMRALADWALLAAIATAISLPGLISAITQLSGIAGSAIGGTVDLGLGNLAAPVPDWSAAGVWLTGDYRFPLVHVAMTHRLDVFVIVFAVLGILYALGRRRWVMAFIGIAAPIALAYYIAHTTAWLQFKAFTITGVLALTLAFVGAAALHESRRRVLVLLSWLAAAVIAGGVLYGNAIIYHDTTLAPAARYHDLAAIGRRYAGQGPTLFPAFDEYAEYFLGEEKGSSSENPANDDFELAPGVVEPNGIGFSFSLNQFRLSFLQKFNLIVTPRGPLTVRAPSNWDLIDQTPYFDVWRRTRPATDVFVHLPLSGLPHERTPTFCRGLQENLRQAGFGSSVAYVTEPAAIDVPLTSGVHPDYWKAEGSQLVAYGAGSDRATFKLPHAAKYSIWMEGTVGRPIKFLIDGHTIGTLAYEERYPNQFLHIGATTLGPGRHTLTIVRGGGSLHPGSGDDVDPDTRGLGPVVLVPQGSRSYQVHVALATAAASICKAPVGYEWMEVLRPGAASAHL